MDSGLVEMETMYLLTGLLTVVGAVAGLAFVCHLEKRSLSSRREEAAKSKAKEFGAEGLGSA